VVTVCRYPASEVVRCNAQKRIAHAGTSFFPSGRDNISQNYCHSMCCRSVIMRPVHRAILS